jgi:hypothetical protein
MFLVKQNEIAIRSDVMALWLDLVNLHGAHGVASCEVLVGP